MLPKPLRLIGLARRAGKLICGSDAVKDAAGRAKLIFIAADAGQNVRREAERYGKRIVVLPYSKEELGHAAGRGQCAVAAVIDEEFGILEALGEEQHMEES